MEIKGKREAILELIKTHGLIKLVLVSLFFIATSGFIFFILGSFLRDYLVNISAKCGVYFPFLSACQNISDFGGMTLKLFISLALSRKFTYNLLKSSLIRVVIWLILICIAILTGAYILNIQYAKNKKY